MFIAIKLPVSFYRNIVWLLYGITLILLIGLFFFSSDVTNTQRWYDIFGFFRFQPSELAKLVLIITLAVMMGKRDYEYDKWYKLLMPLTILGVMFALIIKQPDLGTGLILMPVFISMIFWGDTKLVLLAALILPPISLLLSFSIVLWGIFFVLSALILFFIKRQQGTSCSTAFVVFVIILNIFMGILGPQVWNKLKPYQQKRIITFLYPEKDVHNSGYQVLQARYAIGSGGVTGKGFLKGTQKKLEFLPENHTDFIFSVLGEEFGLVGIIFLFFMQLLIVYRGLSIALSVDKKFDSLLAVGVTSLFFWQSAINMGMNMGLLPVTGLPLPLISYGGTSLLISYYAFGVLLNIGMKRHRF